MFLRPSGNGLKNFEPAKKPKQTLVNTHAQKARFRVVYFSRGDYR